jgi:hypothetical protein
MKHLNLLSSSRLKRLYVEALRVEEAHIKTLVQLQSCIGRCSHDMLSGCVNLEAWNVCTVYDSDNFFDLILQSISEGQAIFKLWISLQLIWVMIYLSNCLMNSVKMSCLESWEILSTNHGVITPWTNAPNVRTIYH